MNRGSRWLLLIVSFLVAASIGPVPAQETAGAPTSASPQAASAPEYEVRATSRVLESSVSELDRFTYEVELSWEGAQQWFSLDSPEVEWPNGIRQIEASQKSGSAMGPKGPVGTKAFLYRLEAQKAGEKRLPPLRIQLLSPGTETPITVDAPGTTLTVHERKTNESERLFKFLSEYWLLVGGVALLLVAAVVLLILNRQKGMAPPAPDVDPWELVEGLVKKAESLRAAGRDRDYYDSLEKTVREGLVLATAVPNPTDPDTIEGLPTTVAEELKSLLSECSERKYRPDRPRPEEMDRSLRQVRTVIKSLKELHQKRGPQE